MPPKFSLTELLPETPPITIAHVGASIIEGVLKPYIPLMKSGHARVFAFEPNPAEHAKLQSHFGEGFTPLPYFVGNGEQSTFYETTMTYTGSLLEPNRELLECFQGLAELVTVVNTHTVETRRLDDLVEFSNLDYLKIDIQGAELQALQGARRLLSGCMVIETEVEFVELYRGQPLFADIDQHLRHIGFQFHTLLNQCGRCYKPLINANSPYGTVNQLLWADAVYVRDFLKWDDLSETDLTKLAVLVNDLYGSVDLCLAALVELDRRAGKGSVLEDAFFHRLAEDHSP